MIGFKSACELDASVFFIAVTDDEYALTLFNAFCTTGVLKISSSTIASLGSRTALPGPVAHPAFAGAGANAAVEIPPTTTNVAPIWFKKSLRVVVLCKEVSTDDDCDCLNEGEKAAAELARTMIEPRQNFMVGPVGYNRDGKLKN
mmetsp:Transcript_55508/g.61967  ORF Transcript_55508/g.61967 Transcript_55508/m.61967 type:complete len:145 (-) Transcript_55508:94-528(-)